jgi:TolB-like protein/Tfp pilus assembly protein PilF
MAHIEGKSLKDVIREGKLSIIDAIEFTKQICEGLHKAHESGVVHRDIKPGNIIIDRDNKARILDFGLATVAGEDKLTKTGSTLGTVGYMSPEQIEGKQVDHRSDLFSVGVILYEMLTGRRPFEGDTDAAVSNSIRNLTPEPVARYKSGTTGELQQIVDKALSKDPSLRYQHADGMLVDLKGLSLLTAATKSRIGLWMVFAALVLIVGSLLVFEPWNEKAKSPEKEKPMVAVLPFVNLGSEEDEVFADGITEEITSRLGMIPELGVISRTSATKYKNTEKALPEIAAELNVDYILEGTVQWDKSGDTDVVRITPQLIDCAKNTHVWTEIYDEVIHRKFQVQGDISSDIAAALDITLAKPLREAIYARPTTNDEAYTAYLRALEYDRLPGNNSANIDRAALMFEQAIKLDSNFALAWAGLAYSRLKRFAVFDRLSSQLNDARVAAQRSLDIDSKLAEGHLALGWYYVCNKQLNKALAEFDMAEKYRPSLARIYDHRAMALENRDGFTDESLREVLRAVRLDPLDGQLLTNVATVYLYRREIDKVIEFMDRAIAVAPDEPAGYATKAYMLTEAGYDPEVIRAIYNNPVYNSVNFRAKYQVNLEIATRNYESALAMLDTCDFKMPQQRRYFAIKRAWVFWLMGDTATARQIYDTMRVDMEQAVAKENRNNELDYVQLAVCYAVLGLRDKAVESAERALKYAAGLKITTFDRRTDLARIYTMVGEYDKAIDELEQILAVPNVLSVPALKMHPEWDPLRGHPRFQALIEKYEKAHGT